MTSVAFFGKMPSAADFVRRGVSTSAMRDFENWFHGAYTELRGTGARGLSLACRLIVPLQNDASGVIAAMAVPSRDRIGREFPVVVATRVPRGALPRGTASLVLGFTRFWDAAATAIADHLDGEPDDLWRAIQSVPLPSATELSDAELRCSELLQNLAARQMEQDCFPESDDRYYAYHTLRLAVRDAAEGRVLVCPAAGNPAYRAFWVETIERATAREVGLPVVWAEDPDAPSGTLVALGKAPGGLLRYVSGHGSQSNSLWPLTTGSTAARERAKAVLEHQELADTRQTLSALIDVVLGIQL